MPQVRVVDLVEAVRLASGFELERLHGAGELLPPGREIAARIGIGDRPESFSERFSGRPLLPVPGSPYRLLVLPRRIARTAQLLLGYLQVTRLPRGWSGFLDLTP